MKRLISFVVLFFVACIGFSQVNNFSVEETYVGYFLADSYVNIIEYNITHNKGSGNIYDDVQDIKKLISNAQYLVNKYNIKNLFAVEESISNEGSYIKGTYDLLTSEKASVAQIEEVFSKVLNTKVTIKPEGNSLNMYFDGTGIRMGSNNAEGQYSNGKQIKLSWPMRLSKMEIVFSRELKDIESITSYISEKISSPEKTVEEIDYLKNAFPELTGVEKELQDNCDIVRLQHLKYYTEIIEEYKQKTGKYPFQTNSKNETYAFIYNKEQKKYSTDTNKEDHKLISPQDFFAELAKSLGRDVDQKYDPQYVPTTRPVFYIYMITGDTYYFAVHLSKYYPFSKKVDANYYKVEISNKSDIKNKFYTLSELINNDKYINAVNIRIKNTEYFLDREQKHLHEY